MISKLYSIRLGPLWLVGVSVIVWHARGSSCLIRPPAREVGGVVGHGLASVVHRGMAILIPETVGVLTLSEAMTCGVLM